MKNPDTKSEKKEIPIIEAVIGGHAASGDIGCA